MRSKLLFLCGAILLAMTGCDWLDKIKGTSQTKNIPSDKPTAQQLITYLNNNAMKIDTIQVSDLDVDARRGVGIAGIGLTGTLVAQRPHNFRMEAYGPGAKTLEADLGSNDREFWFYLKRNDPPYLFHCAHGDVQRAELPFPFHPDWIIEALGMSIIPSTENFKVNVDSRNDTIELVETTRSPQGQPIHKVTVFSRRNAYGTDPQVVARKVLDMRGKEIYAAVITEMQQDPRSGIVIPRRLELQYPAERMRLAMALDGVAVNAPLDAVAVQSKFQRPNYPGVQPFDLARRGSDHFNPTANIRPAGNYRGYRN